MATSGTSLWAESPQPLHRRVERADRRDRRREGGRKAHVHFVHESLVLRMRLGVFLAGLMPSAQALVAGLVPRERRGAAFDIIGSVNAAANGLGPLAGAGIATSYGFRAVFLATGALFAVVFGWVGASFRSKVAAPRPDEERAGS